ncbi:MAG: hypothetical protein MJ080_05540 [Clostridia bacterium]|nr:hypothetical protein [Clostridia bacterium]
MKSKYIFLSFYLLLIASIGFRVYELRNYINIDNGQFTSGPLRQMFIFVTVVTVIISFALSFLIRRCPVRSPKVNISLCLSSLIFSLTVLLGGLADFIANRSVSPFSSISLIISAAVCVFGFMYSSKTFIGFHIPGILYVIPLVFWLYKLIVIYVRIAKMSLISENAYLILATASIALFSLYFAKYANGMLTRFSHKLLLLFGFLSVIFSETFALPSLIYYAKTSDGIVHNSIADLILYAVTGVMILIYLISFFSNKNLLRHHKSETKNILPIENGFEIKDEEAEN